MAMSNVKRKRAARTAPEVRAAEIRHAARALAVEGGLRAVTLRAVAARGRVAPALVAHYEPSMDALVASTFTALVGEELAEVVSLVDRHTGSVERMRALLETLLEPRRDDVTAIWVDGWSMGRQSDVLADAVRDQMDAWQAFVLTEVSDGVAAGDFTTTDADAVAWQLIGTVDGLNAQALVHYRDMGSRGRLLAQALEHALGLHPGALGGD
jgi:AcrR family transcriptional regulator